MTMPESTTPGAEVRPEAWLLTHLGYATFLSVQVKEYKDANGNPVLGSNFLDAYPNEQAREKTLKKILAFQILADTIELQEDPDYDNEPDDEPLEELKDEYTATHAYFMPYMEDFFGELAADPTAPATTETALTT